MPSEWIFFSTLYGPSLPKTKEKAVRFSVLGLAVREHLPFSAGVPFTFAAFLQMPGRAAHGCQGKSLAGPYILRPLPEKIQTSTVQGAGPIGPAPFCMAINKVGFLMRLPDQKSGSSHFLCTVSQFSIPRCHADLCQAFCRDRCSKYLNPRSCGGGSPAARLHRSQELRRSHRRWSCPFRR